ncbi:phage tail tape measure protein [Promicromonospora vindobonensis]|uniref:Phage tail tape measure protein n=1 Tax=Promicromonospora vindobonensis TaxID=195748 RepID=A0ABW5VLU6_9MICO
MIVNRLESIFTGDLAPFEQTATKVETRGKAIDGNVVTTTIDADAKAALDGLDKVDAAGRKISSAETVAKVDADIDQAQADFDRITAELDTLRQSDTTPEVTADIAKATAALDQVEAELSTLRGARATMVVEADTSKAEDDLDGLADKAEGAGADGGERAGAALGGKIVAALATIPIAGAVVGIITAVSDSVLAGLDAEVNADTLAARTGLDEATVARLGRAAGEAYASNWGESIAANMDTARVAIESGLLDPQATERDAQAVIASLSGVSDLIGEEIPALSKAASTAIRTGLAEDAAGALDLIVKGSQAGLNVSEDLLDVIDEYGTQFRKVGLDGEQAFGLISQAVQAGARDTDIAADAIKEFSIRAVDGSELSAEGFEAVGLNAEKMTAQIAEGGDGAAKGLDQVLDGLRKIEDPAKRDAAAVALFGTQAEDLGEALFAMDLSTAADEFGSVEGAADRALSTLGDNAKGILDGAVRNIDLAASQVKGSLAIAFSPEIEGFATFVTENREAVVTTLFDAADAAVGFGIALAEGAASGTEAFGDFASSALPPIIEGINAVVQGMGHLGLVSDESAQEFDDFTKDSKKNLADFDESTERTAEQIRTELIDNALTPTQDKLNEMRIPAEAAARLSDTTNRLAGEIGGVGYAADGSKVSMELLDGEFDTSTRSGRLLDEQVRGVAKALDGQVKAAAGAGESQKQLRGRVRDARDAFIDQVTALGLTKREAGRLADEYGLIPERVDTDIRGDGRQARAEARETRQYIDGLHAEIDVAANTGNAYTQATALYNYIDGLNATIGVTAERHIATGLGGAGGLTFADGGFNENHVAQIAPAGAWRVWAEPETGGEAYIPLAPSKRQRSMEILEETASRMGARVVAQADGSVLGGPSFATSPAATFSEGQFARLEAALERGAARGLAGHEAAQDRASRYARSY